MIRDRFGEIEGGEWHFPKYTKGCWGDHKYKLCWMCKIRAPVKFIKMLNRLRKA